MADSDFASQYLKQHGWKGLGTGLDPTKPESRSKPITAFKKKDLGGIGKNRDQHDAWWDQLYSSAAKKKEGVSSKEDHIASAKQTAAQEKLYKGFTKGGTFGGTLQESSVTVQTSPVWQGLDDETADQVVAMTFG